MSTQYLIKRRKIIPVSSSVGLLKDYQLIMNMGGPNFLEPSFANIRELEGSNVEGVVHEIDKKDLQKIVNTEGEDYELVLSLPPIWAERWLGIQPNSFHIGRITKAADTVLWSDDNTPVEIEGFEHFPNN